MREALLAAMAMIVVGAALYHWNGPQQSAYSAGGFRSARNPNCPPPYWQSRRPMPAAYDEDDGAGRWERVKRSEPGFLEPETRGAVTTAFRRAP